MRKTKYHTNVEPHLDQIPDWRIQGLTEEQIAKKLGVAYSTFRKYRDEHPALSAALKKGKEELIIELEKTLYQIGMGYHEKETVTTYEFREDKGKLLKVPTGIKEVDKYIQPNVGALIFALKNIAPSRWQDNPSNIDGQVIEILKERNEILRNA